MASEATTFEGLTASDQRWLSSESDRRRVAPLVERLRDDGLAIAEGLLEPQLAKQAADALAAINARSLRGRNDFAGHETVRAYNVLARTRAFDPLILHPDVLAVVETHLGDDVQLSIATGITQLPGAPAQDLHRDDGVYPIPRPHRPLSVSVMWALDDFTEENGATVLCPGSHRDAEHQTSTDQRARAAMPRGSAVFWDGSTLHGSGVNRTDVERKGLAVIYNVAWLRQYENQYLGLSKELVRSLSPTYRALLGFRVVHFTLGLYDGRSPLRALEEDPPS